MIDGVFHPDERKIYALLLSLTCSYRLFLVPWGHEILKERTAFGHGYRSHQKNDNN